MRISDWSSDVCSSDLLPVDEGGLRGGVTDLQGRYNLNNLAVTDPPAYEQQLTVFIRLFQLTTEGDEYQARDIANATRDYSDSNNEPTSSGGAEDADSLGLDPAPPAPHNQMDPGTRQ